jgi:general secretion pathway protein K
MSFAANCRLSNRCYSGRASSGERGWALISVLWAVTMLALMAAATQALTVTSYVAERHAMIDARADADLDAAVARAVLGISDLRPSQRWRVDGGVRSFIFDGQTVRIAVQDEAGRIDLNTASGSLIRQLLAAQGLSADHAGRLADSILDWRSTTGLQSLNGATVADYRAARRAYGPRHGPFQTVDELKLVLGMTPGIYFSIRPALTVYSKRPTFDTAVAPPEVLRAIYPGDAAKIDQIRQLREGDPKAAFQAGFAPGATVSLTAPSGRTYSIEAETTIGRRSFRRLAVVELTGDTRRPYFVLAWK